MRPATAAFHATLKTSHAIVTRADLWYDGACVAADLPVVGGKLTVEADAIMRGRISGLSVADPAGELVPTLGQAHGLHPYGALIHLRSGVVTPAGVELLALGWYPVRDVQVDESFRRTPQDGWISAGAVLGVEALDRMIAVADYRFMSPETPPPGATCLSEIRRLCDGLLPVAAWPDGLPDRDVPASIAYQESRLDAVASLAAAAHVDVYADDNGALAVTPVQQTTGDPVAYLSTTDFVVTVTAKHTRDGVYNAVVAHGEDSESAPVSAVAYDTDPDSPTRWDGPCGRVPAFYSSPVLTTVEQCASAAASVLGNYLRGRDRTEKFTAAPHPALQVGDIVAVTTPRAGFVGPLTSIELPLTADGGAATYEVRVAAGGNITVDDGVSVYARSG
jgi:hypothetical protein